MDPKIVDAAKAILESHVTGEHDQQIAVMGIELANMVVEGHKEPPQRFTFSLDDKPTKNEPGARREPTREREKRGIFDWFWR